MGVTLQEEPLLFQTLLGFLNIYAVGVDASVSHRIKRVAQKHFKLPTDIAIL